MADENVAQIQDANFDVKKVGKQLEGREAQIIIGAFGDIDKCTGIVEKKTEPPEGGIYTKFVGCSYLFKGYPNIQIVSIMEIPKNLLSQIPEVIGSMPFHAKIASLFFVSFLKLFAKDYLIRFVEIYLHSATKPLQKYLLPEKRYCTSVREIYRVMGIMVGDTKTTRMNYLLRELQSFLCMSLEYDTTYKFRLQDILPEFNKQAVQSNPVKEIKRVSKILIERENMREMKRRWKKIFKIGLFVLKMSRKSRRLVKNFFEDIDLEKVKLDEADWYFCLRRHQYNFQDKTLEERGIIKERIDKEKGHKIPPIEVKQVSPEELNRLKQEQAEAKKK